MNDAGKGVCISQKFWSWGGGGGLDRRTQHHAGGGGGGGPPQHRRVSVAGVSLDMLTEGKNRNM